jgi:tetratricopeptide (TPR) repeat protein
MVIFHSFRLIFCCLEKGQYFQATCLLPQKGFLFVVLMTLAQHSFGQASAKASTGVKLQSLAQDALRAEQRKDYAGAAAAYQKLVALRPADPFAHQSLGLAWYLQGNYAKAVNPLERALTLDPRLWGARLYLGICYYRTNQFQKAVDSLKLTEQAKPKEAMVLYWLGASHLALKNFAEATAKLERASAISPKDPEVWHTLARAYAGYSEFLFEGLLQTAPQSGSARLVRAEDFWRENLTQPALELLLEAVEAQPPLPGLHLTAGEILWQERKFEEAAEAFRKELMVDPACPQAHRRLAAYHQMGQQPEGARSHLEHLARLKPRESASKSTDATFQSASDSKRPAPAGSTGLKAALTHYAKGEMAPAIAHLRLQLKSNPEDVEARRLLARCFLVDEQFQSAVSALQELLKIRPEDPEAAYLLAKACEALASQVVQKMAALEPDSYRMRLLRGEAHEKSVRREYSDALAEYLEALKLKPESPGVAFAVGRILWKMNRFDEAVSYLEKELALNPQHGLANYYLGNIFLSRGENDKALACLEIAVQAQPGLIQAHRDRGRALASMKKYDEAVRAFQKVAEANPEDSSIHALMAATYRAMGRLDDAKRCALIAQQLSEKRRQMPAK